MGTSTVDGVVAEATVKRTYRKLTQFSTLRFDSVDGQSRTIKNAVVTHPVAELLKVGNRGRFYLFTAMDVKGVHGARLADGRSIYGFPGNNKNLFLVLGIISIAAIALMVMTGVGFPLLPALVLLLSVIGYPLMAKSEREAKAQYDGDGGYVRPPATPLAGA